MTPSRVTMWLITPIRTDDLPCASAFLERQRQLLADQLSGLTNQARHDPGK
jgi:hypothetical protein